MAELEGALPNAHSLESLLCLKCRESGHLAGNCDVNEQWTPNSNQFEWFFSPDRRILSKHLAAATQICQRCKALDLLQLLRAEIPWRNPTDLIQAQQDSHPLIRNIGQAGTIELRTSCPVCVCLFALTPSPASAIDDILLFPDWTMNRLAGENGTEMDREEKQRYSKCLLVALQPNITNISFYVRGHRGDAMCIVEEDLNSTESLGGRNIQLDKFNIEICNAWLESCHKLHGSDCDPEFTDDLQGIRLVDISTREIVAYPGSPCEYAALSYVWGVIDQKSYPLGSKLDTLPKTIENAMACAKLLGMRYIWVDSLCIDQTHETDKADQIGRMWSIYRGSSITLITLSSSSVESGLPRFNPDLEPQPQLSCTIDGVRLVGLMPTLSQYIWTESWGSRAWTLQEALLSHRCLYLSDHQIYFECETMQYCESLDERRSWAHGLNAGNSPDRQHWLTWVMEQNGSGCLRNLLDTPADRFLHWGQKITLYSYRSMTKQEDGLRAFSGVLQRLQTMYTSGFFWGLPLEDFQWALLWQAQWPPQRRQGFPTWCWAGWQTGIMTPFPSDIRDPHRMPVPLRVWKAKGDKLVLLFDAQACAAARSKRAVDRSATEDEDTTTKDIAREEENAEQLVAKSGQSEASCEATESKSQASTEVEAGQTEAPGTAINIEQTFNLATYKDAEEYGLFMETLTLQFQPDWSKPTHKRALGGLRGYFVMEIDGVKCLIYIMTSDTFITRANQTDGEPKYLLLAFDTRGDFEQLFILAVYDRGGFCTRGTSFSLLIPSENSSTVLEALKLKVEHIVLA